MRMETILRDTLRDRAEQADPPRRAQGLAALARWRARERRNRQVLATAAVLAVALAGALAISQLERAAPAPMVLSPSEYALPDFPYTPGWQPEQVRAPHVWMGAGIGSSEPEFMVEHEATEGTPPEVLIQLLLLPADQYEEPSGGEPVLVRGMEGVFRDDGRWLTVAWTDSSDRHLLAGASKAEVGRTDLLRYIEELEEKPMPVTLPVTLQAVPVGSEMAIVAADFMQLALPDGERLNLIVHDPALVSSLRHDLRSSPSFPISAPLTVEVAGRPGQLVASGPGQLTLSVEFGPELMLTISPWRDAQESLLAFAAGAELTEYARAGSMSVGSGPVG